MCSTPSVVIVDMNEPVGAAALSTDDCVSTTAPVAAAERGSAVLARAHERLRTSRRRAIICRTSS